MFDQIKCNMRNQTHKKNNTHTQSHRRHKFDYNFKNRSSSAIYKFNRINLITLLVLALSWTLCEAIPRPLPLPDTSDDQYQPNFAVAYGAPLITPLMEDVTLEPNSNYTLRCEANEPIEWKVPQNIDINESADIKSFNNPDPDRPYGSMLYLYGINSAHVGNYYCVKKSSKVNYDSWEDKDLVELINSNQASTIYIFVNDKKNLLVSIPVPIGYAHQYQDITIPCKPTHPDVEVLLTTPQGETFSSENTGRYDPRRGFVIEIRGLGDGGEYICRPKNPSVENDEELTMMNLVFVGNEYLYLATTTTKTMHTAPNAPQLMLRREIIRISDDNADLEAIPKDQRMNTLNKRPKNLTKTRKMLYNSISITTSTNPTLHAPTFGRRTGTAKIDATNYTPLHKHSSDSTSLGIGVGFNLNVGVNFGMACNQNNKHYNHNYVGGDDVYKSKQSTTTTTTAGENFNDATKHDYELKKSNINTDNDQDYNNNDVDDFTNYENFDRTTFKGSRKLNRRAAVHTTASPATSRRSYDYRYRSAPRKSTTYINKPKIISATHGHVYEGESFNLTCEVVIAHDVRYNAEWTTPPGVDPSRMTTQEPTFSLSTGTHNIGRSNLTVSNAQKSDSGVYKCTVTDHSQNSATNQYTVTVLRPGESYINISEPNNYYILNERANKTITINVQYRGFPIPTLTWYKPDGTVILPTQKYVIEDTKTSNTLKIRNAQMLDSGEYLINATNGVVTKTLKFQVNIKDKPIVSTADIYVQEGEEARMECKIISYTKPTVQWTFRQCSIRPRWPSCEIQISETFNSSKEHMGEKSIEYVYELNFRPLKPGIVHCIASNQIGKGEAKGHVLIGDITDNMTVSGVDENMKIARGDEITITCAALAYYFSEDLNFYKDGEIVTESDNIQITTSTNEYSYKKSIKFKSVRDSDRGSYECRARDALHHDLMESKYISIFVHEPYAPTMLNTNLDPNVEIKRKLGEALELECKSKAIPMANVNWYKDDVKLNANNNIAIEEFNSKLVIPFMKPEDQGMYKCVVSNRLGSIESSALVKLTNIPFIGFKPIWILAISALILILVAAVILLIVRDIRKRKFWAELKKAGLANFEEGAVEHINPALALDEQADLLPYDRRFEFPREKLKLGKQLGAGAFGVVLKANAEGIKQEEKESVVAVKMVKRTADNEVMRALVSELKIMVHLGQHLNVVNLLGAVTKNIAKRELMVIVEYARYGNVQNFLLKNRKRFINQINPKTDRIDPTITTQRFSDNFEINRNSSSDNDPRSGTRAGRPKSSGYVRQSDLYEGQIDSCATEQTMMTTIPEDEANVVSNNTIQPAWRSNYKSDSTEAMTVTTSDLISWAFQVSRGMDYLCSKKVLHGDLAARNILLCEDNIVKICDFGLARTMYKSEMYEKQGEARLPIKWLALESLSDSIFSKYSDVWSFGIVLWEFFSLAKVPYPGIDPNQSLYLKLKDGYRMEKPPYANDELYDIMLECWSANPESRPLFNVLEKKFARMLEDEVTNHYVDLNEPYLRINTENSQSNPTDYLALMGSPDEMAPPPPRYVNGHLLPEIRIDPSDDYLKMSIDTGTAIFSPTRPKDYERTSNVDNDHDVDDDDDNEELTPTATTSFMFPDVVQQHSPTITNNLDSPVTKHRVKKETMEDIEPEEIPMLSNKQQQHQHQEQQEQHHIPEDDEQRQYVNMQQKQQRKTPTSTFMPTPSPRHHIADTRLSGDGSENYVNVKSPQKILNNNNPRRGQDAFSNPSYQMLKTVKEGDK